MTGKYEGEDGAWGRSKAYARFPLLFRIVKYHILPHRTFHFV